MFQADLPRSSSCCIFKSADELPQTEHNQKHRKEEKSANDLGPSMRLRAFAEIAEHQHQNSEPNKTHTPYRFPKSWPAWENNPFEVHTSFIIILTSDFRILSHRGVQSPS